MVPRPAFVLPDGVQPHARKVARIDRDRRESRGDTAGAAHDVGIDRRTQELRLDNLQLRCR